ncbi:hypothetical protein [Halorarius halobius]|uniref:hypothetical protein n=1 Tax=Halorarius halobius TaxID=2962671 RepID=UPI0020CE59E9|nr:hypothetical protein [Halorarius halobius]
MADHPHAEGIQLLYDADADHPSATLVNADGGPELCANTGHTDDAVEAQLELIATHMRWLADRTDVPVSQVATDAVQLAEHASGFEEQ